MTDTSKDIEATVFSEQQRTEMEQLGIQHVTVDTFHVGEFRYSNLTDAIAQAKRTSGDNISASPS